MVAAVSPPWWSEIDDGGKSLPDPLSLSPSLSLSGKEVSLYLAVAVVLISHFDSSYLSSRYFLLRTLRRITLQVLASFLSCSFYPDILGHADLTKRIKLVEVYSSRVCCYISIGLMCFCRTY